MVFAQLPDDLHTPEHPLETIEIFDDSYRGDAGKSVPGVSEVARRLGESPPSLPIVWPHPIAYLPTVEAIWRRLPSALKKAFSFSFQFTPEHKLPVNPTLIATLPALSGRWPSEQIIDLHSEVDGRLNSVQSYFAGLPSGDAFDQVLDVFGITISDFAELGLLSQFVDLATRLGELSFAEARRGVRIIEKYSKLKKLEIRKTPDFFLRICALVESSSADEIVTLRNLDGIALGELIPLLQDAILRWISNASICEDTIAMLETMADDALSWWGGILRKWLSVQCARMSSEDGAGINQLIQSPRITVLLDQLLSDDRDVEQLLMETMPQDVTSSQEANMLMLAKSKEWMRYHALCLVRRYPVREAVKMHATECGNVKDGFDILSRELGLHELVEVGCSTGSPNIMAYCIENFPTMECGDLGETVYDLPFWGSVLMGAVKVVSGRLNPPLRPTVVSTLERGAISANVYADFLSVLLDSDPSVLLELQSLNRCLASLPPALLLVAISRIQKYVWDELAAGRSLHFGNSQDVGEILDAEVILRGLCSVSSESALRAGVHIFKSLQFLRDGDCRRWLIDLFTRTYHSPINSDDARVLADFLLSVEYPLSAAIVRETAENYQRWDVYPVYQQIRYKYEMTHAPTHNSVAKKKSLPKVIVATALPLERSEVVKFLGQTSYDSETYSDVAEWPPTNPCFEIFVLTTGAGNLEAQGAVLRLLQIAKPKLAFFVGVAGGIKDSEVGDVIYSTKVHYFEGGKEEGDSIRSRPSSERSSEALVQLAHRVADFAWQPACSLGISRVPKASPAVIVSGEKVLVSTSSAADTFQRIRGGFNDAQVVDMEGYGFMKAMKDCEVRLSMVIRGVSDKLSDKSDSDAKGNQPLAAGNAAAFLFALLQECPDVLKPKGKKKGKRR